MAHSDIYAQIDKYAYTNRLSKCSPVTKAIFALATLVVTVSAQSIVVPILVLIIFTSLILGYVRIKPGFYMHLLEYPTFMLTLSCIILALFFGLGEPLIQVPVPFFIWTIFKDGINIAINTFFRVEGAISCLFFLVLTTSMTDLSLILRRIHVPAALVEISMLIYRYIFVFLDVSAQMTTAQKLRIGEGGYMKRIRGLGLLAGNLFIRTMEQGERTFVAMSARGYDGNIRVLDDLPKPKLAMIITVIIFEVLLVVTVFLTIDFGALL